LHFLMPHVFVLKSNKSHSFYDCGLRETCAEGLRVPLLCRVSFSRAHFCLTPLASQHLSLALSLFLVLPVPTPTYLPTHLRIREMRKTISYLKASQ
jgi:hypothetical protein